MQRKDVRDRLAALTPREFDVLKGVVAGMLNKQIAAQFGTTEGTIKVHRGRVMEKMGATSVAELVILAQRAGIAPTSEPKAK
jgi:FixJ family two-component response regulator